MHVQCRLDATRHLDNSLFVKTYRLQIDSSLVWKLPQRWLLSPELVLLAHITPSLPNVALLSNWAIDRQQHRALMSRSSLAVAIVGVVGTGPGSALGVLALVLGWGARWGQRFAREHSKELGGGFGLLRSFYALTHLYSPYPSIMLGAKLQKPFLSIASTLYLTPGT